MSDEPLLKLIEAATPPDLRKKILSLLDLQASDRMILTPYFMAVGALMLWYRQADSDVSGHFRDIYLHCHLALKAVIWGTLHKSLPGVPL